MVWCVFFAATVWRQCERGKNRPQGSFTVNNHKKGERQKTVGGGGRGGGRSTYRASYLGLSVLADRIEVFSIYANRSHRRRITNALCQESSSPPPPLQSLHPLLWATPCSLPFRLEIPSFSLSALHRLFSFLPSTSPLFYRRALEDTLLCKSDKSFLTSHTLTRRYRLNAG